MLSIRQPSVMIFTPCVRLQPETVSAIMALEWGGPLIYILQRDNPSGSGYADHLHQYQRGRWHFLASGYEYLLIIEDDIVPPPDTLTKLYQLDVDLAYGCYMFRSGVVNVLERYPDPARNTGESLSIHDRWPGIRDTGPVDCSGSGLGCLLVKRHVIEAHPFEGDGSRFFDWDWNKEVFRAGYTMKADTTVLCGHHVPAGVLRA